MSWVANILLSVDVREDSALVHEFDQWLQTQAPRRNQPHVHGVGSLRALHDTPEAWGGQKHPEALVWAGVLNHADIRAVVQRFGATRWRIPDLAQLMIMDQEQGAFRIWMIRDGNARQYLPLPDFGADDQGVNTP
ncbi:squamosa promoter-binding protein 15 [Micromonospora sp. NPDC050187]|uniref:squamosa promoter-binding protein 15 n=1 Tax=Micromonospora sp. NPDC050187 TaxID=3364277 RepID=UPI00379F6960